MGSFSDTPSTSAAAVQKKEKDRNKGGRGGPPGGGGGPGGGDNGPQDGGGNDTITGVKGDDTLAGGAGNDTLGAGGAFSRSARAAAAAIAGKPGRSLLDPVDPPPEPSEIGAPGRNLLEANDSASRSSVMRDEVPSRGQIGPAAYERSATGPAKGTGGPGGTAGSGNDSLAQQVAAIKDIRDRQKREDMERERQALERASRWSGYTGPGPGARDESDPRDRGPVTFEPAPPKRRSLFAPPPRKPAPPPRQDPTLSRQRRNQEALKNIRAWEREHEALAHQQLNQRALEDIKAYDEQVAPEAEIEEARNRSLMEDLRGLKELGKGPNKPSPPSTPVLTDAQIAANARMVEALARTAANDMLAGYFAESILSGSPVAQSVYGDFIGQLSARAPDRVEAFEDAVTDSLAEQSGWNESAVKDVMDLIGMMVDQALSQQIPGGMRKQGYAHNFAYQREAIARWLNNIPRKDGKLPGVTQVWADNLDKDHQAVVHQVEHIARGNPLATGNRGGMSSKMVEQLKRILQ